MNKQWIAMTLVTFALMVAGGCNGSSSASDGSGAGGIHYERLHEAPGREIPDVPVPIGFDLVEHRSLHFSAEDRRFISYLYKGRKDTVSVAVFFRDIMPKYRWQEIDYGMAQGERVLNFRKGPEKCTISFRGGGSWLDPTYITVNVAWTGTHMSAPMGPTPLPDEYYEQPE